MRDRVQNFLDKAKLDKARLGIWILPLLLVLLLSFVMPLTSFNGERAGAAAKGSVVRSNPLTSGSWAIVAHGRNQPTTPAPYILVWTVTQGTAYDYFYLRNVGTTSVNSFHVLITQIRLTGTTSAREIFFERCIGGSWDPLTHLCSGTILQVGRASDALLALTNVNLASNEFLDMRARTLPNNQSTFETTLSTQVTRSDARPGQVGHS